VTAYKVLGEAPQLHHTSQKSKSLPQGFFGAGPGDGGRWVINEGTTKERVLDYAIGDMEVIAEGDTVTHHGPAGGGYGPPHAREPWRVQADARDGLISLATAETVYGLRLDPETFEIVENLRPAGAAAAS
jgi:N-methylhydantoinase B